VESDDGLSAGVVEGDDFAGHGVDYGCFVSGDEWDGIVVGKVDEEHEAAADGGRADVIAMLDDCHVRRGVVVLEEDVVGEVDVDLCSVFLDAVARDRGQRVAEVETLAIDRYEDDEEDEEEKDELFHQ
jgi:hypothetical protein